MVARVFNVFSKAKFVFPLQKQKRIVITSRKNVAPEIQSYEIGKLSDYSWSFKRIHVAQCRSDLHKKVFLIMLQKKTGRNMFAEDQKDAKWRTFLPKNYLLKVTFALFIIVST